jgi:hypothetical protein
MTFTVGTTAGPRTLFIDSGLRSSSFGLSVIQHYIALDSYLTMAAVLSEKQGREYSHTPLSRAIAAAK